MITLNDKKTYLVYIALALIFVIAPLTVYFIKFPEISEKTQDFANFGAYFGGIATPFLTFLTLIILILTLLYQQTGISQASADNRNNLLLPKCFEAFDSSYKNLFNLLDSQIEGSIITKSGKGASSPSVSNYILFYNPQEIPKHLESGSDINSTYISLQISLIINEFFRLVTIEKEIVKMNVPYFCIEKKMRELQCRFRNMQKILFENSNIEQLNILNGLNRDFSEIEKRLSTLEPAEIKRNHTF